jgi:hypothetical protein
MMDTIEIFQAASPKELFWLIFFIFFPAIVPAIVYILIFKKLPIGNPIEDLKTVRDGLVYINNYKPETTRRGGEGDYYYDEYEHAGFAADDRPAIRHPKNRDRANQSGA